VEGGRIIAYPRNEHGGWVESVEAAVPKDARERLHKSAEGRMAEKERMWGGLKASKLQQDRLEGGRSEPVKIRRRKVDSSREMDCGIDDWKWGRGEDRSRKRGTGTKEGGTKHDEKRKEIKKK